MSHRVLDEQTSMNPIESLPGKVSDTVLLLPRYISEERLPNPYHVEGQCTKFDVENLQGLGKKKLPFFGFR